ncbi:MAG: L,D-transpeptidase family protein [Candidatus Binatia bacterium]
MSMCAIIAMGLASCAGREHGRIPAGYPTLPPPDQYTIPGEYPDELLPSGYTVEDRLEQFGVEATRRLAPSFHAAGLPFPPEYAAFLAFKDQRLLEVFARTENTGWRFIRSYAILGASGHPGPKLRQGDRQVPEGVYRVTFLNPNSIAYVSLRLDYPNAFDQEMAALDGRDDLGGDIMIHGGMNSTGCLAMGDEAAEDLFTLAALTTIENISVVISPTDFRRPGLIRLAADQPLWTEELYDHLRAQLAHFGREAREPLYVNSDVAPFSMPAVSVEGNLSHQQFR